MARLANLQVRLSCVHLRFFYEYDDQDYADARYRCFLWQELAQHERMAHQALYSSSSSSYDDFALYRLFVAVVLQEMEMIGLPEPQLRAIGFDNAFIAQGKRCCGLIYICYLHVLNNTIASTSVYSKHASVGFSRRNSVTNTQQKDAVRYQIRFTVYLFC